MPLYDTLGPDAVEYIIGHAEITLVFASAVKMRALVEPLIRAKGKVKALVVWGEVDGIAQMVRHLPMAHAYGGGRVPVTQQYRRRGSADCSACLGIVRSLDIVCCNCSSGTVHVLYWGSLIFQSCRAVVGAPEPAEMESLHLAY